MFAVVAAPESGEAVRIYETARQDEVEPAALGRLVAAKLILAGAGELLQIPGGGER